MSVAQDLTATPARWVEYDKVNDKVKMGDLVVEEEGRAAARTAE